MTTSTHLLFNMYMESVSVLVIVEGRVTLSLQQNVGRYFGRLCSGMTGGKLSDNEDKCFLNVSSSAALIL